MPGTTETAAPADTVAAPALCALADLAAAPSPLGHATPFAGCVAVEIPLPWPYRLYDRTSGTPFARMRTAYGEASQRNGGIEGYRAGRSRMLIGIAPDEAWSVPGHTRVIDFARPDGRSTGYDRREFLVPDELAVDLVTALFLDRDGVARFAPFEVPANAAQRDVLVCTHGAVDACCGRLGYPLYSTLRVRSDLRTWRAMHFGGHRFAPTIIDLPSGYSWAHLDTPETASAVLDGPVPSEVLDATLRGTCAMPPAAQVVDGALLAREGWAWRDIPRAARILHEDGEARTSVVEIEFERPSGERGVYRGVVGVRRELSVLPCLASDRGEGAAAEYEIRSLERMDIA